MLSKKSANKELIQSVSISGLGCDAFQQSLLNVYLWDVRMSRQFEADVWSPWSAVTGKDHPTVLFSNRILTPAFLCEDANQLPIPTDMGKQIKGLVEDGTHKYIQDNEVGLYEHIKTQKTNR